MNSSNKALHLPSLVDIEGDRLHQDPSKFGSHAVGTVKDKPWKFVLKKL